MLKNIFKKHFSKTIFVGFLGFFIFASAFYSLGGGYVFRTYKEADYQIPIGMSSGVVRFFRQLEEDNMIRNKRFALFLCRFLGLDKKIKAGFYTINNRMGTWEVIVKIVSGKEASTQITVLEGTDIYDLSILLEGKKITTTATDALRFFKSEEAFETIANRFGVRPKHSVEGFLYPDTYHLRKSDEIDHFFLLMLDNFEKKIKPLVTKFGLTEERFYEKLIVASLIEKETSLLEEKPLVSSVLYNRLQINEKLRYDPTIIYALKERGDYFSSFKEGFVNIQKKHYLLPSLYNTYYVRGLPLGPICSPDISSFKAALLPATTDYLFFVAKGDGSKSHAFSKTYEEHKKNIAIYLKRLRLKKKRDKEKNLLFKNDLKLSN